MPPITEDSDRAAWDEAWTRALRAEGIVQAFDRDGWSGCCSEIAATEAVARLQREADYAAPVFADPRLVVFQIVDCELYFVFGPPFSGPDELRDYAGSSVSPG